MKRPGFRRQRRPEGVDDALWAYATSERLAADENAHFVGHPLIESDIEWVIDKLGAGEGLVADLGCGAGRASLRLARLGWNVVAIDLSRPMLERLNFDHTSVHSDPDSMAQVGSVTALQANLSRLDFLPAQRLDAAICLFSTLGMMRRAEDRERCLRAVGVALKPNGRILLHAHNWFVQAQSGQGLRWMLADLFRRLTGNQESGNRGADYRGIPGIHIHLFTFRELHKLLTRTGFEIVDVVPLDAESAKPLSNTVWNRLFHAGGWLIEAKSVKVPEM